MNKVIELKDLISFAANPVRFYLRHSVGIILEEEETLDEEFFFSPKKRFVIRKDSLKLPIEKLMDSLEKEGAFPPGIFKEIEKKRLIKEIEEIKEHLKKLKVGSLFDLKISEQVEDIEIRGTIENVSSRGLVCFDSDDFFGLIKNWPQILLFFTRDRGVEPNLLLIKEAVIREASFEDLTLFLKKYLEYFKGEDFVTSPAIEENDIYFKWISKEVKKEKIINEVFKPLLDHWSWHAKF